MECPIIGYLIHQTKIDQQSSLIIDVLKSD